MSSARIPLETTVQQVEAWRAEGRDFVLLDCRENDERRIANIEPSEFVPISELPERAGDLAPWKNSHLVVFCHHGVRSLHLASWLRQQGFAAVQSMAGGIDAWSRWVDPSIPRY